MASDLIVAGQRLPPVNSVCRECLESKLPKLDKPRSISIYCEHNQAAAIMHNRDGVWDRSWLIVTPISAGEFTAMLTNGRLPTIPGWHKAITGRCTWGIDQSR
jgi:hypothetical protein